jgi:hypothetical protein
MLSCRVNLSSHVRHMQSETSATLGKLLRNAVQDTAEYATQDLV